MFSDNLQLALTSYGMSEQAFISLLRDEIYLSKEKIFAVSKLILSFQPNIILTKIIGNLSIKCRRNKSSIDYIVNTTNKCVVSVDLTKSTLIIKYKDTDDILIESNLLYFEEEHNDIINLRQEALNEILTRYFAKILIAIYKELRWYL